jgi:ABC-2 type transport system permease protein
MTPSPSTAGTHGLPSQPPTSTTAVLPPAAAAGWSTPSRPPGWRAAFRVELRKLASQSRARYTLLICLLGPIIAVAVLNAQQQPPKDTIYGRYIHTSGYAVPLLILGFAAQWVFPIMTSIVAGDIFASEDSHGTWKTILTRSVSRTSIFCAKTLTAGLFAVTTLVVFAISTIVSSIAIVGHQPLEGLNGQLIPSGTALGLVIASWALMLTPLLGFTALAILLSVRTRNPAVGIAAPLILGFIMQLTGGIGGVDLLRRVLLTTSFESWHGLLVQHRFYDLIDQGIGVSIGWILICLSAAYLSLRNRDITGG